ncbi:MAG: L,D-transpeptidase family protein [Woeseiaceae bacterium]
MMRLRVTLIFLLPIGFASAQDVGLPAYILELPDSVATVLIAEADTATLHNFRNDEAGLQPAYGQRMSIGRRGVGKRVSGDRRTPLGIYFVVDELDTTSMHEKYGPAAFPLDYPNTWDNVNDRTGSGIWIHGVVPGSGLRPELDTDGCIALPNDALLELASQLMPLQTPVLVTRKMQLASREEIEQQRGELMAVLKQWERSYRDGDWHQYLSLYAEDFSHRGMNLQEWSTYRLRTVANREIVDFTIDDLMLFSDPEEPGLYLSRFRQTISEADRSIATMKRLYWRKSPAGDLRIVAEDNG